MNERTHARTRTQVLITTPEMILAQDARELAQLPWEVWMCV
jgi:hypothetical protein